jgi:hypothetical protein
MHDSCMLSCSPALSLLRLAGKELMNQSEVIFLQFRIFDLVGSDWFTCWLLFYFPLQPYGV